MVFSHTPEIPIWAQLPVHPAEGMIHQFMPGLPGLVREGDRTFMDLESPGFSDALVGFYEEYLAAAAAPETLGSTRFALTPEIARGFFVLQERLSQADTAPVAVKGQVTGPLTFAMAVKNREGRAVYYDDQARDVAVKTIALKARWQARELAAHGKPVILFLDEPALAGFGSSEFISISRQSVVDCLNEVIEGVHAEGALAGIHVCANTEWDMIMETNVDIVNLDAYGYFDRFILYADAVRRLFNRGGIIAWVIVPTLDPTAIETETAASLADRWDEMVNAVCKLGIAREVVLAQSLISPSCGTGPLSVAHALRVLELTQALSKRIRERSRGLYD